MSSTRHAVPDRRPEARNSSAEANTSTRSPVDRKSPLSASRIEASSSTTETIAIPSQGVTDVTDEGPVRKSLGFVSMRRANQLLRFPYLFKRSSKDPLLRPSRRAAADWLPPTAAIASRINLRSTSSTCWRRLVDSSGSESSVTGFGADCESHGSHLPSLQLCSSSQRIAQRSTTFCSSRMFPGQEYVCSASIVLSSMLRIFFPVTFA